jgi:hypothetical protein
MHRMLRVISMGGFVVRSLCDGQVLVLPSVTNIKNLRNPYHDNLHMSSQAICANSLLCRAR